MSKHKTYRLNINSIQDSLQDVKNDWEHVNSTLLVKRDELTQEIIDNLLAGYSYIDFLIEKNIDIFLDANQIIELNHIVLCGENTPNNPKWIEYKEHILATRQRVQKGNELDEIIKRYEKKMKKGKSVHKIAAGVYSIGISQPQLFFEGNHRAGTMIASYILVKAGYPPFVLTRQNAKAFFDPSSLLKKSFKDKCLDRRYYIKKHRKALAEFLEDNLDKKFLIKSKNKD